MLTLTGTKSAVGANITASFLGVGGTAPYVYSVVPGGAGGSIDSSTGLYTAPAIASSDPLDAYDTVQVTDSLAATATLQILVGSPLLLFCDVIQTYLTSTIGLGPGRVWLWDQKIFQPTDSDLYIAVSVPSCKPFGNNIGPATIAGNPDWSQSFQMVSMLATLDLDIISRGPAARDQKEMIILALNSIYSQQQQEANSFYIGKIPPGAKFLNLSLVDGAAIPYRYRISVNMQYVVTNQQAIDYFDTFSSVPVAAQA